MAARSMTRHLAALLVLILLATLAGCGSDSNDSSSNESNGIESKSPQQILEQTAAALRSVKSFHIEGTQARGTETVTADVAGPKELRLDLKQRDAKARMVFVDGAVYMNANAAFWRKAEAGQDAKELDGRWLKVPGAEGDLEKIAKEVDPANLSRCLLKDHGTLASGGTGKVGGQPAVVILDKGDRPGTSPGRLYVAPPASRSRCARSRPARSAPAARRTSCATATRRREPGTRWSSAGSTNRWTSPPRRTPSISATSAAARRASCDRRVQRLSRRTSAVADAVAWPGFCAPPREKSVRPMAAIGGSMARGTH